MWKLDGDSQLPDSKPEAGSPVLPADGEFQSASPPFFPTFYPSVGSRPGWEIYTVREVLWKRSGSQQQDRKNTGK
jgi:hypothetical protein